MKSKRFTDLNILSSLYKGNEDYIEVILQITAAFILAVVWLINGFQSTLYFAIPFLVILFAGRFFRKYIEKYGNIYTLLLPIAVICYLSFASEFSHYRSFNWIYILFFLTLIPSVNYNLITKDSKLIFIIISIILLNVFIHNLKNIETNNYSFINQFTASFIKMLTSGLILYYFMLYFIDLSISKNSMKSLLDNTKTHKKIITLNIETAQKQEKNTSIAWNEEKSKAKYSESGISLYNSMQQNISTLNKQYRDQYELIIRDICKEINAQTGILFIKEVNRNIYNFKGGYAISNTNYSNLNIYKEYGDKLFENNERVIFTNASSDNIISSCLGRCVANNKVLFLSQSKYIKGVFEFHFIDDFDANRKAEIREYFIGTQYFISTSLDNIFFNRSMDKTKSILNSLENTI